MRPHDWTSLLTLGAAIVSLVALARGAPAWALVWFLVAAGAAAVSRYWSRTYPGPMPHRLAWALRMPRGNHSPQHLQRMLEPQDGERLLEIGPGIGIHALPVASALAPGGSLEVLDVQQAMLDELLQRASKAGVTNIIAKQGDAQRLPYPDASFDGAYLVSVLGEVPNEPTVLRELRRVLKPTGRLVVGEVALDPDFVSFGALTQQAGQAGFVFERKSGGSFSYLARFRPG